MTKDTVIKLANDTKYFLLDEYEDNNLKYFYAVRLDNKTEEPTSDYIFLEESNVDGKTFVKKVIDKNMEQFLFLVFTSNYVEMAEDIKKEASEK